MANNRELSQFANVVGYNGGNIGIGTDNPVGNLEVRDSKANLIVAKDGLTVKSNSNLHTTYDMLQIGAGGALASYSTATATADTQLVHNAYRHSGGTQKYRYADTATRIMMNSPGGTFRFQNAASGSADADITFIERLRITDAGNIGIGTDNPGLQSWRSGKILDIHGGAGNVTGELHIGANRGDGVQSVGSINFYDNTQDSTHRHVAIIESDKGGDTINKRGGQLLFYTKPDNVAAPVQRLRITSGGNIGINCTPSANDLASGASFGIPKLHVLGNNSQSGAYELLARFQSGADADNSGSTIVLNHANDRGLALQGGRSSGNTSFGAIKSIDNLGRLSNVMTFIGGSGQGVDNIIFYTGNATVTTTERLRITSTGQLLINTSSNLENSGSAKLQIAHTSGALLALGRDHSAVTADNDLGKIAFYGNDGGSYEKVAQITCEADGSHASGDKPGRLLFATTADGASSPTERLRIASDGKITTSYQIVNDTAPDFSFEITQVDPSNTVNQLGGSGVGLVFKPATNSIAKIGAGIAAIKPGGNDDETDTDLAFYVSQNDETLDERLRITSQGYVLKPSQPVFWAYRTSFYNLTTSATEMVYDTEKIDVGGNYNTSNGRFTAPFDGLYEFGYASIGHNTNTVYRYALRVNGAAPYSGMTLELRIDTNSSGSEYGTNGEYCCYVNMIAGQTASVYATSDTSTNCYGNSTYGYTYFRGRLIG